MGGTGDDVAVGEHVAVGGVDDARAAAEPAAVGARSMDVRDAGPDPVDRVDHGARIGVERVEPGFSRHHAGRTGVEKIVVVGNQAHEFC